MNAIEIRRIASLYSMLVGASMMGMWVVFLLMGQVPELESIPVETAFSILADSITGLILLIAGYGLYTGRRWGFRAFLVSLGALFYSLIIAIGYFAQKGDAFFVGIFAPIFVIMIALLALRFKRGEEFEAH